MPDDLSHCLTAQHAPMKEALIELVRIPSVCDEGGGGLPLGEGVDLCLRRALQIAADLGFRTRCDDGGTYGIAEIGEGDEMLGILGHLDVVPPGNIEDWARDPFDPIEIDGMLFGRGTQDDKGPVLAALFAARALLDTGVTLNKRVRFIFGADEETLWRCINRYMANEEVPALGFSPDSRFPLTFAEKGLLQLQLSGTNESGLALAGGSAFNAVPDRMVYGGAGQDRLAARLDELGFPYGRTAAGIEVHGKAAHAMEPENGINAVARLCIALEDIGITSKAIRFVAREIGEDPGAARVFGPCADAPSGALTLNVGKIELAGEERLSIDCRIPVTVPKEQVVARLSAAASAYGLTYAEFDWLGPLYLPLDHPLIETLMDVYRRISGDSVSEPLSSGGATYARSMANCVAFGALTPGEPITEHQANERVVLANLYQAMEIYAHAIAALAT